MPLDIFRFAVVAESRVRCERRHRRRGNAILETAERRRRSAPNRTPRLSRLFPGTLRRHSFPLHYGVVGVDLTRARTLPRDNLPTVATAAALLMLLLLLRIDKFDTERF